MPPSANAACCPGSNTVDPDANDVLGGVAGIPLPVTLGGTMAYKYVKGRKEANKISEFINYGKEK